MKLIEEWESCPLGALLIPKNNKSKQVKSTEYETVGSYPVVDQSAKFICGYHDDATKLVNTNLPLTVFGDHTRHTKFISFPFIAGADGTQLLKPIRGIEDRFFYYLISSAAEKIGNYGYDRHFKHLKEYLCQYPPSKPEQTKIAEVLSTVDRAIEQTEALIAKQQRIKTSLMQDLLTCGIDEHGNIRSEETHKFKDSSLKGTRIPYIWIDGNFRKVTSVNQGLQIPIEKRFKEEGPNRHKYITIQYLNSPDKYLEYIEKPSPQLVCKEDEILFTRTGNTGQIITGIEGVYHNNFFKVAYDKTKVDGDYLVQFLNWQPIQELIRERAGTTTIPDLNHGDFYSLPLFLPDLNEQKLIRAF